MKQTSLMYLVLLSILFKNVTCLIWENLLLDTLTVKDKNKKNGTEKYLNMTELVEYNGYPVEEYTVETEDGYLLKVGRIPGKGPLVFLMHGLVNCADDYMTLGKGNALSFLLADAGYDVWLGNARGNKYSTNHVTLSTEEKTYWNFTFHEIGYYDLPAMFDFALKKSNKIRLTYVGHSQGTTAFFILASMRPEYNKKVELMVSLATIAWTGNLRSPFARALVPIRNEQYFLSNLFRQFVFLPSNALTRFIFRDVCSTTPLAVLLCETFLFLLYGFDYWQLNMTQAPVELGHFPAGSSAKQVLHFLQLIESKDFRQFDYGTAGNLKAYGSETPSPYSVENITTPIAIVHGMNDWLSDWQDVQIFIKKVPSVFDTYRVPYERWNHMDHLWAQEAKALVYNKVLNLIKDRVAN